MLTLFAAITPPAHVIGQITSIQKGIEGAKWRPPGNLHITLGYFGGVDLEATEVLDKELARAPVSGFTLQLSGVDVFGGSRPHTLWLGVHEEPALCALHTHVRMAARRARLPVERRKFVPHLTLAYLRKNVRTQDVTNFARRLDGFRTKTFLVDEFALFSSKPQKMQANIYIREANYPLPG